MKTKFFLSVFLIIFLLIGGFFYDYYLKTVFSELEDGISLIENVDGFFYNIDDVYITRERFRSHYKFLVSFLPHNNINEIEYIFGEIIGSLQTKDYKSAAAQLCRLREVSKLTSKMFTFRIENFL
ncbi:MAG: DUF4363 family protein [Christensenellaceae bacterium]|jgi:hypothetical protein|nr:DUF4363 family protein [Christensenellaceae bacterium]